MVCQFVRQFAAFYVHKSQPLVPVVNQINVLVNTLIHCWLTPFLRTGVTKGVTNVRILLGKSARLSVRRELLNWLSWNLLLRNCTAVYWDITILLETKKKKKNNRRFTCRFMCGVTCCVCIITIDVSNKNYRRKKTKRLFLCPVHFIQNHNKRAKATCLSACCNAISYLSTNI
jgi:hypothetical protein